MAIGATIKLAMYQNDLDLTLSVKLWVSIKNSGGPQAPVW
jgi:hypothetical protein